MEKSQFKGNKLQDRKKLDLLAGLSELDRTFFVAEIRAKRVLVGFACAHWS